MVTEATLMELFNGSLGEIFKSPTGQPPCVQVSMAGAINRGSGIVAHMMERTAVLCSIVVCHRRRQVRFC
jgi:hypothetical protein